MQAGLHSTPQNIWLDAGCRQPDSALCLRTAARCAHVPLSIRLWRKMVGLACEEACYPSQSLVSADHA